MMSELQNKVDGLGGKIKEAAGDAVSNDDLTNQGKGEQVTSEVKQGAGDLKDRATKTLGKPTDKQNVQFSGKDDPNRLRA